MIAPDMSNESCSGTSFFDVLGMTCLDINNYINSKGLLNEKKSDGIVVRLSE